MPTTGTLIQECYDEGVVGTTFFETPSHTGPLLTNVSAGKGAIPQRVAGLQFELPDIDNIVELTTCILFLQVSSASQGGTLTVSRALSNVPFSPAAMPRNRQVQTFPGAVSVTPVVGQLAFDLTHHVRGYIEDGNTTLTLVVRETRTTDVQIQSTESSAQEAPVLLYGFSAEPEMGKKGGVPLAPRMLRILMADLAMDAFEV